MGWTSREQQQAHYELNKPKYLASADRQRQKIRAVIDDAKAQPCTDCGIQYPPYVMDFDHVRGEKRWNIGVLRGSRVSMETLLDEIAKCDLVCANCHRERTHQRGYTGAFVEHATPGRRSPPLPDHGRSLYRIGCRCDICRQANTDHQREYRSQRRLLFTPTESTMPS